MAVKMDTTEQETATSLDEAVKKHLDSREIERFNPEPEAAREFSDIPTVSKTPPSVPVTEGTTPSVVITDPPSGAVSAEIYDEVTRPTTPNDLQRAVARGEITPMAALEISSRNHRRKK